MPKPYPADIDSYQAEPDFDDETGHYLGCGHCDECGESFQEGEFKIIFNDHVMHKTCAEAVRDKFSAEIAKH